MSERAVGLALTRTYLAVSAFGGSGGGDQDVATCVADGLIHQFSLHQLNNPQPSDDDIVAMQTAATSLYATCGDTS